MIIWFLVLQAYIRNKNKEYYIIKYNNKIIWTNCILVNCDNTPYISDDLILIPLLYTYDEVEYIRQYKISSKYSNNYIS